MVTCSANGQRHTAVLNCEISAVWETKPRTTPHKTYRLLMGRPEEATRPASHMMMLIYVHNSASEFSVSLCEITGIQIVHAATGVTVRQLPK
jgi:protein gp37